MGRMKQTENKLYLDSFEGAYWVDVVEGVGDSTACLAVGRTRIGVLRTVRGRLRRLQKDLDTMIRREERKLGIEPEFIIRIKNKAKK